jgi:hypothetical protein
LKTSRLYIAGILIANVVASVKLSSALLAAQKSGPASDESALLKTFAEIQPIDVHTHIYKDDRELSALIKRLNLRAVNICVVDDRDPDFNALKPQRTEVLKSAEVLTAASPFALHSARMGSKNRDSAPARFTNSTRTSPRAPWR